MSKVLGGRRWILELFGFIYCWLHIVTGHLASLLEAYPLLGWQGDAYYLQCTFREERGRGKVICSRYHEPTTEQSRLHTMPFTPSSMGVILLILQEEFFRSLTPWEGEKGKANLTRLSPSWKHIQKLAMKTFKKKAGVSAKSFSLLPFTFNRSTGTCGNKICLKNREGKEKSEKLRFFFFFLWNLYMKDLWLVWSGWGAL